MKPWTVTVLAAVIVASGAIAQSKESYNLNAATRDLEVFQRLARDGILERGDARSDVDFGSRFGDADIDGDGALTAHEMDRYIERTYGVTSVSAGAGGTTDSYRLYAATRDLKAFYRLSRDGVLARADAQEFPALAVHFEDADVDRDGVVNAQEMDRYVQQTYGIASNLAFGQSGSASIGSGRR